MTERSALQMPLQSEAMNTFHSGENYTRRSLFVKHAPDWLLEKLLVCVRADPTQTARLLLTVAVNKVDYRFSLVDTEQVSEDEKRCDYDLLAVFCALSGWLQYLYYLSTNEMIELAKDVYRSILVSTNDFSPEAAKAKFVIRHWELEWGITHEQYNAMYGYLVMNMDAVEARLPIIVGKKCTGLGDIRAVVETPLALSEGIL